MWDIYLMCVESTKEHDDALLSGWKEMNKPPHRLQKRQKLTHNEFLSIIDMT